jgi:4-amino-4-deoxy-L-arabinose transferase-like glycosyltransferase
MQKPDVVKGRLLAAYLVMLATGLLVESQTQAFTGDEGYHLVAAQSIIHGRRPYLDFCFPQSPLNAYWNAAWMRIFGDTWRTAHAVAALLTALAVVLTADYLRRRFPVSEWRMPLAITAVFLFGLNARVFFCGPVGQAYGICLFGLVAAFRAAVRAVEDERVILAGAAGLFASVAANSSLLTAPVPIVLLIWIVACNRAGSKGGKAAAFIAGCTVACIPLAWLFLHGPRQTIFNIVEYQGRYRRVDWPGAISHDIDVLLSPFDSSQALVLGVLAVGGLVSARKAPWDRAARSEFYLCAWLAIAEIVFIANGHPTFSQYYMFAVPFLTILACLALYAAGTTLAAAHRPRWPVLVPCLIVFLAFAKSLYERHRDYESWREVEAIAQKIREIHPAGPILADDAIYFLLRYPIPPGFELNDSHKLDLGSAMMAKMHLVSKAELERQIRSGYFDLVETWASQAWKQDTWIEDVGLPKLYAYHIAVADGDIYWGKVR